ncbi:MAG: hypothetical protein HQL12_08565 [Candidatus Omnitrophica bacterium]|nr:hypothetical protein [Candidatus Omnitrophota bacterium]
MNRFFLVISLFIILIMPQAWGASSQPPNPYRQTVWNNLTDGMHTLGQTPQQARSTKMRLRHTRAINRIKNFNHAKHKGQNSKGKIVYR